MLDRWRFLRIWKEAAVTDVGCGQMPCQPPAPSKSRQRINSRLRADANLAKLSWRHDSLITIHAGRSLLKSEGPFYQWICCNVCVIYMGTYIRAVKLRWCTMINFLKWMRHLVNAINTWNLLQMMSSRARRGNKNNHKRKPPAHLMGSRLRGNLEVKHHRLLFIPLFPPKWRESLFFCWVHHWRATRNHLQILLRFKNDQKLDSYILSML